jgi:hypothetical protein
LSYGRSRVFIFIFFMPKILGNNSGKNNESFRINHNGSNIIGVVVFLSFYDFIRIFKVAAKVFYYLR